MNLVIFWTCRKCEWCKWPNKMPLQWCLHASSLKRNCISQPSWWYILYTVTQHKPKASRWDTNKHKPTVLPLFFFFKKKNGAVMCLNNKTVTIANKHCRKWTQDMPVFGLAMETVKNWSSSVLQQIKFYLWISVLPYNYYKCNYLLKSVHRLPLLPKKKKNAAATRESFVNKYDTVSTVWI